MSDSSTPWTAARQAPPLPPSPWVCSNSCPLSWWCYLTMSSSVVPFFSCLQSPSIRVFSNELAPVSGGQSIGASASVLPMNIQGLFPLGLAGLISLLSNRPSRVFSKTTVWNTVLNINNILIMLWGKLGDFLLLLWGFKNIFIVFIIYCWLSWVLVVACGI